MFIIFVHVIIMKMYCLISVEIDNHNAYNSQIMCLLHSQLSGRSKTVRRLDTKTKAKAKDLTSKAKAKTKGFIKCPRGRAKAVASSTSSLSEFQLILSVVFKKMQ